MRRRIGDRKDGWRLRKVDPFFKIIPHIMKERSDAQVFFSERIYLDETLKFIREIRREGYKLGFLQVVIASMVRVLSQKPKVNRFVCGKKVYARNEISISLAVKKEMSEKAEETTIKVVFDPEDTIYEVIDKLNAAIDVNKVVDQKNDTDRFVKVMSKVPGFIYGGVVGFIKFLDYLGIMPKFIHTISPFHSSVFVTDLGSLGIKPVYHHLYNFGTNSVFISFGTRIKEQQLNGDQSVDNKKALNLKIVADERIVDGFYFSQAIKMATKIMQNPAVLREKPEQVIVDDEI